MEHQGKKKNGALNWMVGKKHVGTDNSSKQVSKIFLNSIHLFCYYDLVDESIE
jgi:hypothetical protein